MDLVVDEYPPGFHETIARVFGHWRDPEPELGMNGRHFEITKVETLDGTRCDHLYDDYGWRCRTEQELSEDRY